VNCGAQAPVTETDYTLIGSKHAWRCKKTVDESGNPKLQWYCPACWKKASTRSVRPPAKK